VCVCVCVCAHVLVEMCLLDGGSSWGRAGVVAHVGLAHVVSRSCADERCRMHGQARSRTFAHTHTLAHARAHSNKLLEHALVRC